MSQLNPASAYKPAFYDIFKVRLEKILSKILYPQALGTHHNSATEIMVDAVEIRGPWIPYQTYDE